MKLYSVFIKQDTNGKVEDIKFLKEGISLLALLFSPIWFAYHRMWREFFAVIIITLIISHFAISVSPSFDAILQIILCFIIAINANYWFGEFLQKRKDYDFAGVVFGQDLAEAKMNFTHNFGIEFDDLSFNSLSK